MASSSETTPQKVKGRGWHGDPEGHARAGHRGGQSVSQNKAHMAEIGRRGGSHLAQDRAYMAEIGRRGGQAQRRARLPEPSSEH